MTFDFSPDLISSEPTSSGMSPAVRPISISPLIPRPAAPPQPSLSEVARLVRELFSEGTLSWDQLNELARVPELKALLDEATADVPAGRRLMLPSR